MDAALVSIRGFFENLTDPKPQTEEQFQGGHTLLTLQYIHRNGFSYKINTLQEWKCYQ